LKRQIRTLASQVTQQERQMAKAGAAAPSEAPEATVRFSAKGLRSHRKRLGLSAGDYAKLVGVTQLSIYNWERGVARPRSEWLHVLASLRSLSKREAKARLEQLAAKSARPRRRR
jgi:DNA-binding transcriptional regulator YiaG